MRTVLLLVVALVGCGGATTDESGSGSVPAKGSTTVGSTATGHPSAPGSTPVVDRVDFAGNDAILYWTEGDTNGGRVRAARLDGSGVVTVATSPYPSGVAVDAVGRKIYWVDNINDTIRRANLDGTLAEVLYTASDKLANPNGIAVDHAAGKIFWTESSVIKAAGLAGESPVTIYTGKVPTGVSAARGSLAFTDNMTDSMTLGTYSGATPIRFTLSSDATSNPTAVAIGEAIENNLFWAQSGGIFKMAADGSARVEIASAAFPGGIAIEPASRRIYFSDNDTDTISYVGEDGTSRTVVYTATDRSANPRGVAIRP